MRDRSDALPPTDWWSASSAGFARAPNWGRLRRGPSRPPPIERRRWALIIALARRDGDRSSKARPLELRHPPVGLGAQLGGEGVHGLERALDRGAVRDGL